MLPSLLFEEEPMADQLESLRTSKEDVAFKLYQDVISAEDYPHRQMAPQSARQYLLDTYAECLHATRGLRDRKAT